MIKISMKMLKVLMEKFKVSARSKVLPFIANSNIDKSCLDRSKLHLNRRGSSFLTNNFQKFVNSLWKSDPFGTIHKVRTLKFGDFHISFPLYAFKQ